MRYNDILFFNLHRRYLDIELKYGGFLGIFVLAAFLNDNGYDAQSFAGALMEGKKLLDEACQNGKVQAIGLYCDYENVTENQFLSRYVHDTYNLPVFIGGPQATALDRTFYEKSQCTAVVRHEGEMAMLELLECLLDGTKDLKDIKGISFLQDQRLRINPEQPIIENLDALPFIDRECYLVPKNRQVSLSIMTGRGCPFHCAFCYEGAHTCKVRFRSVANVLQEIENYLQHNRAQDGCNILFTDDTFTLLPDRVKELCDGLKKLQQRWKFTWFCEGHVHTLYQHPEMITYIADAKCWRIQLGIEAGTQKVLDAYRKGCTLDEIRAVVARCREEGISQIYGNIILGSAFYDRNTYYKDLSFAKELLAIGQGCLELGVVSYWPLAETSITETPEKYGLNIIDREFITAVGDFPQTETAELNKWQLADMMKEMKTELGAYMDEMLQKERIPEARLLSWVNPDSLDKYEGQWWYRLTALENLNVFRYYRMLYSGEGIRADNLSDFEVLQLHPMRVIPLFSHMMVDCDGVYKIFDCFLDIWEREIVLYTTGKLSVNEIVQRLEGRDTHFTKEKILQTLKRLEKHHLIIYSKY